VNKTNLNDALWLLRNGLP